jgi:hypothetical protein
MSHHRIEELPSFWIAQIKLTNNDHNDIITLFPVTSKLFEAKNTCGVKLKAEHNRAACNFDVTTCLVPLQIKDDGHTETKLAQRLEVAG